MTPSAAQGLLSAVFWKPQFRWVVQAIEVLAPVRWATMRRNEVGSGITATVRKRGFLDADSLVQQRMTLMLRDVAYRVHAQVWVHPEADEQNPAKWRDQFRRRLDRGQTFRTPFFGMREFHADVEPPDATPPITSFTQDLGIMLHSIHEDAQGNEFYEWFHAQVNAGRMDVPTRGMRDGNGEK
jgi:CRISPR-associated protein Cas5d